MNVHHFRSHPLEVALKLLKNSRWFSDDEAGSIAKTAEEILKSNTKFFPESVNELMFHQAIIARDQFEYAVVEDAVANISDADPVWKLRKASLLADLGRFDEGEVLLVAAYKELLVQHRNDKGSIYILSRLAWAHWLLTGIELNKVGGPIDSFSIYDDVQCNPWNHVNHIRDKISEKFDKQQKKQKIEPLFEPGRYQDNSTGVSFSNEVHPLLTFDGICNATGLPIRWDITNFLAEAVGRLAEFDDIGEVQFALSVRSANSDTSDVINKVFSRINVAQSAQNEVERFTNSCIGAVKYWADKRSTGTQKQQRHALDNLRIFIEVLARLVVRASIEQSMVIFKFAMSLGKDRSLQHFWLFSPLGHLIKYTLKSIPKSRQHLLLLDALFFPLITEEKCGASEWPNPVIQNPGQREGDPGINRRIDEIIEQVTPCTEKSGDALMRLLPLVKHDFLTIAETNKLATAIWGEEPDYQTLPETGLVHTALLVLPCGNKEAVRQLIRTSLFELEGNLLFDPSILSDITQAAHAKNNKELPNARQAANYFNSLVAWRPQDIGDDLFNFSKQEEQQKCELISEVLACSVVPCLSVEMLTLENFDHLYAFYNGVESPELIPAFLYFAHADNCLNARVTEILKSGLQSKKSKNVAYAAHALLEWRRFADTAETKKLISRLIYYIEASRTVGLTSLLRIAGQICDKNWLPEDEMSVLVDCIPKLFNEADYHEVDYSGQEAISVSMIRTECVKLAKILLRSVQDETLRQLLDEAKSDALPEVRFADES